MRVIEEFISKEDKSYYLFDMDNVLTVPRTNLTEYERFMTKKYIILMSLKRNLKSLEKAKVKLGVSPGMMKRIVDVWLQVNTLNKRIIPTLDSIKRNPNNVIVLATNNCPDFAHPFLEKNGIMGYFQQIFAPEYLRGTRKPEALYYKKIAKKLGADIPNMILIDDSKENVEGIKKIGGKGILYTSTPNAKPIYV